MNRSSYHIIKRWLNLVLVLTCAVLCGGVREPASAARPSNVAGKAVESKEILQFTSGGHVLGFRADGVYFATGSHSLRVEFVNAHPSAPLSAAGSESTSNQKKAAPCPRLVIATYGME